MNKKFFAALFFAVSAAVCAAAPVQAQTVYSGTPPDHYLPNPPPPTAQQPVNTAPAAPVKGGVVYSSDQYPTAQGNYLKLPQGYQQAGSQPRPANQWPQTLVTMPVALTAPQYVPPPPAPPAPPPAPVITAASASAATPIATSVPQVYSASPQLAPAAPAVHASQPVTPTSYEDLPSYTYNPALDTAHPVYKTPIAHDAPAGGNRHMGLGTLPGFDLGLQFSEYRYQEHDTGESSTDFVRETGPKFGVIADYSGTFRGGYFITGEFRGAYGQNDYTGSGTASGIPDWLFETRVLGGEDFIFENAFWDSVSLDLSPYAGLGFRLLYNNFSTISGGYDRYSHYFYLPIGVTPRFRITDSSRLTLNMEYDQLLYGWQFSELSDNGSGNPDITDSQTSGYGLRASAMFEWSSWSVGPFINYWNIGHSSFDCGAGAVFIVCGDEPDNQTLEAGIQGKYRF